MKRAVALCLVMLVFPTVLGACTAGSPQVSDAVVKVYAFSNQPDYYNPWSMLGPRSKSGSGVIIEGNRVLTSAHVVADVTFLQVRRHGTADRHIAQVIAVSHQSDLALLGVEDPGFFDGVVPLEIGGLPETHEEVLVYGFPVGGETLSITKGIVSRIEHQPYVHSSAYLLAGQIDAAVNPGNSGGPVIADGKIAGIVMQVLVPAENIGYMVPTPVVEHFLEGIANDEPYRGFPSLGIVMQKMENPHLRTYHRMPPGMTGALITQVVPGSPADGNIFPGDVLLSVGGYIVANDATVEFRPGERTAVPYAVQSYQVGDEISVELLREGEVVPLNLILHRSLEVNWLVPLQRYDVIPTYYIYGGIAFSPLSRDLLGIWGRDWRARAPAELVAMTDSFPEVEGEEVVLLLKVLPADVNAGYQDTAFAIVSKVNGRPILNMRELVQLVQENGAEYTVFELDNGQRIVLNSEEIRTAQERILVTYRIPEDRSPDLRQ